VKFNTKIKLNTHIEYTFKWIHKIEPLRKKIRNKEPGWKKKTLHTHFALLALKHTCCLENVREVGSGFVLDGITSY
jgi:hypothetical protein